MRASFAFHHRLNKPSLQLQPVVALFTQRLERMRAKKFRRNALRCAFIRDCFRAVFAKLRHLPLVIRARPRTALTIEPAFLVYVKQCLHPARQTHLTDRKAGGLINSRHPRRDIIRFGELRWRILRWRPRAGRQAFLIVLRRAAHLDTIRLERRLPARCVAALNPRGLVAIHSANFATPGCSFSFAIVLYARSNSFSESNT